MRIFKEFISQKNKKFNHIQLAYSCLYCISGNDSWFCRIWKKNWIEAIGRHEKEFGESYGKNKFEAYRSALKDLNS